MFSKNKTHMSAVLVQVDAKKYFKKEDETNIRSVILNKIKPVVKPQMVKYSFSEERA